MKSKATTLTTMSTKRTRSSALIQDYTTTSKPRTISELVEKMLSKAGIENTRTKGDWCIRSGLYHLMATNNESLLSLIVENGPPTIYHSIPCRHGDGDSAIQNLKMPSNCFESLCRIIAGQQLAGAAAQTVWKRLLETAGHNLTPDTIILLAKEDMMANLQRPAGLSGAKARSIIDLSQHFLSGKLSDDLLTVASEAEIRCLLLDVKGLGPWSCDMFLMFYLERGDILPIGDFGIRKGLARHFQLSGKGKGGSLCAKNDLDQMLNIATPYQPYRSLFSYYMWKAADITDFYNDGKDKKKSLMKKQKTKPV